MEVALKGEGERVGFAGAGVSHRVVFEGIGTSEPGLTVWHHPHQG